MAEITRERQGQLVRKAFEILSRHPDGLPARDVIARVENELGATPFEKIVRWEACMRVSWIAPAGPDKGVDILAHKDPLGVEGGRIKVQVKRRADRISVVEGHS